MVSQTKVNFYGHAVVSILKHDDPRFVLGAMLPDLAGMARTRLGDLDRPDLAPGVTFHHRCDAAFHHHPTFVAHCRAGIEWLTEAGVPRGPARAVAHVGFEMLLDGTLSEDRSARDTYRAALAFAHSQAVHVADEDATHAWQRVQQLCARLQLAPVPDGFRDVDFTVQRLFDLLARRPRLALQEEHGDAVHAYCVALQPRVAAEADAIVAHVLRTASAIG